MVQYLLVVLGGLVHPIKKEHIDINKHRCPSIILRFCMCPHTRYTHAKSSAWARLPVLVPLLNMQSLIPNTNSIVATAIPVTITIRFYRSVISKMAQLHQQGALLYIKFAFRIHGSWTVRATLNNPQLPQAFQWDKHNCLQAWRHTPNRLHVLDLLHTQIYQFYC